VIAVGFSFFTNQQPKIIFRSFKRFECRLRLTSGPVFSNIEMKKHTHQPITFGLQTICFKRLIFSSLLLLLGSWHFTAQAQYADSVVLGKMARQPLEMVVADFTGDALADIITSGRQPKIPEHKPGRLRQRWQAGHRADAR
jgi:hypothetical protein